jgi:hypothetical protein
VKLDPAVLRNRRDTRREASRETYEHVLDWSRSLVLRSEDVGVVRIEVEARPVLVLLAQAVKARASSRAEALTPLSIISGAVLIRFLL